MGEDVPLAAAALQFPLQHPAVATVLLGTAKATSLNRNLELLTVPVPENAWEKVRACCPQPLRRRACCVASTHFSVPTCCTHFEGSAMATSW